LNNFYPHPEQGIIRSVSYFSIESMIHHEKCAHFTSEEKEKVRWAYNLAHDLHAKQDRIDNKPYIEHIDRSVKLYLHETLDSNEKCNSQYLIALILHDSIEDNDV
jgi:(p)ppGpp synthase/HD superfamily hydrolase